MLLYSQSFAPRFWFQASRERTPVDADGRNGRNCIRCSGKPYGRHYIGGVPIDPKQERVIMESRMMHLWGEIRYTRVPSIDLLAGFAFDSTFRPQMKADEAILDRAVMLNHSKWQEGSLLTCMDRRPTRETFQASTTFRSGSGDSTHDQQGKLGNKRRFKWSYSC
ncbi:hypothetical protein BT93_E1521 [Corymbia citriodora subsp. variegata]|nr:hypothetical protein BT93_E1521 [Corymbia citriodora subsp. variegata]